MQLRLLPTDREFFNLFQQAAANTAACSRRLAEYIGDPTNSEALRAVIACEREGDVVTAAILDRLNTSFVTPFDREDIHALAEEFDDVVDDMQAVARRVQLLSVTSLPHELLEQAELLIELTDEAAELMARLEAMKGMKPHLAAIDRLESQGDELHHSILARLFSGEFEALDVMRWKDLVDAMENSMNRLEDISDVVEAIVLKHS